MKNFLNKENLIYLSLMALPLYLVRFSIFGIPTNTFELIAIISITVFWLGRRGSKIELGAYQKYLIPIGLIIIGLSLSMLFNGTYSVGLGIIKSWFIIPMAFSVVAVLVLQHEKHKTVFSALYVSAFLVAFLALVSFILGQSTFDGRLQSIFNSPNYLAMFLSPAVIIGLVNFKKNKKLYGISLIIIVSALYLTFSYAAWLALFLAVVAIYLWQNKKSDYKKRISILVLSMMLVTFSQIGTSKFSSLIQSGERSSLASRVMIWKAAGKMIIDRPIIGIGPGNFQAKYLAYQKYFPPYLEWAVPEPHNIFLAFWLQSGILGLIGFLVLIYLWGKDWMKTKNNLSDTALIAGAIMIIFLLHGVFDTTYFKNDLAVLFWIVFFANIKNPENTQGIKETN